MSHKAKKILTNISHVILTLLLIAVVLFSLVMITFNVSYIKTRVRGYSMYPTLNENVESGDVDGDIVYINKFAPVSRGAIAVASVDWWDSSIIKRVVGVPGDEIKIVDTGDRYNRYNLYVNGAILEIDGEPYTREKTIESTMYYQTHYLEFFSNAENVDNIKLDESGDLCIALNEDEYFLMSDNWALASEDCLLHGPINYSNFIGRVDIIVHVNENEIISTFSQIFRLIFS